MMSWPKQFLGFVKICLLLCLLHSQNAKGFIVPEQVASASNAFLLIPRIKKGTDSRVGFGFRLGEHKYFQVLLELGPQNYTRPLGNPMMNDQSFNKRQPQVPSGVVHHLHQLYRLAKKTISTPRN